MKHISEYLVLILVLTLILATPNSALSQKNQSPQAKQKYGIGASVKPSPQTSATPKPKDWSLEATKMEAKINSEFNQLKIQVLFYLALDIASGEFLQRKGVAEWQKHKRLLHANPSV